MQHDVAADPCTGVKWTRRTTRKIARELATLGIQVSPKTVARLLKDLDYSLRVNHKRVSRGSGPDRNEQFEYIALQRDRFTERDLPIVSSDTKTKELVGNFKNPGTAWKREPELVRDHDFRSDALGMATPYGIYDLRANRARSSWAPPTTRRTSPSTTSCGGGNPKDGDATRKLESF